MESRYFASIRGNFNFVVLSDVKNIGIESCYDFFLNWLCIHLFTTRTFLGLSRVASKAGLCHTGEFVSRIISSLTFAPLGSSRVSKETKNFKELEFLGLGRCFWVRIEESSKMSKTQPKTAIFGRFFKVCSILAENQRPKPRNSSSLKFFDSFDTLLDPRGAKVKDISQFVWFILKFDNSGALYNFFSFISK